MPSSRSLFPLLPVQGHTDCLDTGMSLIPFYRLNDQEIILLDSGWAQGEQAALCQTLKYHRLHVAGIIASHIHIDHTGNCSYFQKHHGSLLAMPALEGLLSQSASALKVYYCTQTRSEVQNHFASLLCQPQQLIYPEDSHIHFCGQTFGIFHTPGHSPAHICITTPDAVCYLGDALISPEVMAGTKMPYAFILSQDLRSKASLHSLQAAAYIAAHRGIYPDITVLIDDNIDFFQRRAAVIYRIIQGDMTKEDILKAVMKQLRITVNTRPRYMVVERMLHSYVDYLHEIGLLELRLKDGFLQYSRTVDRAAPVPQILASKDPFAQATPAATSNSDSPVIIHTIRSSD